MTGSSGDRLPPRSCDPPGGCRLFDFAKAEIKPDPGAAQQVAEILSALPNEVVIEGHTDNIPVKPNSEFDSNWDLSTKRSIRVLEYFIESAGVGPPERLSASGYGEYRPVAANDTEENRALNRRVDIVLLVADDTGLYPQIPAQSAASGSLDSIGGVVLP